MFGKLKGRRQAAPSEQPGGAIVVTAATLHTRDTRAEGEHVFKIVRKVHTDLTEAWQMSMRPAKETRRQSRGFTTSKRYSRQEHGPPRSP